MLKQSSFLSSKISGEQQKVFKDNNKFSENFQLCCLVLRSHLQTKTTTVTRSVNNLSPTLLTSAPLPCLKSKEVSDSFLTQLKMTPSQWAVLILISMRKSSCLTYSHIAFPGAPATPVQDNISFLSRTVSALTPPRHCTEKQSIYLHFIHHWAFLDSILSTVHFRNTLEVCFTQK